MFAAAPLPEAPWLPDGFPDAIGMNAARALDIQRFRELLTTANGHTNLVGQSTLLNFERRHLIDCAQLVWFEPSALTWADLGSGAGLPGIILAILMKGRVGARVHLVESMAKKCRFLAEVATTLALPVTLHHARAESTSVCVDVVTARACAPLPRLLEFAQPYFARGRARPLPQGPGCRERDPRRQKALAVLVQDA